MSPDECENCTSLMGSYCASKYLDKELEQLRAENRQLTKERNAAKAIIVEERSLEWADQAIAFDLASARADKFEEENKRLKEGLINYRGKAPSEVYVEENKALRETIAELTRKNKKWFNDYFSLEDAHEKLEETIAELREGLAVFVDMGWPNLSAKVEHKHWVAACALLKKTK